MPILCVGKHLSVRGNGLKQAGASIGTRKKPLIKRKTRTITMTIKMVSLQRDPEAESLYEAR